MTLRQDCELWATFDAEDVDPSRGIVRDRSGKGRTLEASGGPTYGLSSPVGEAVGFDGVDDEFISPAIVDRPFSISVIFRINNGGVFQSISGDDNGAEGFRVDLTDENRVRFLPRDADGDASGIQTSPIPEGTFVRVTSVLDPSEQRVYLGDGLSDSQSLSSYTEGTSDFRIGRTQAFDRFLDGEIAFLGLWSRALSDDEIEELTRMTDRMVSKL